MLSIGMRLHAFQGMGNFTVFYPPFEGGGFFAFFAKMTEDDLNTPIPTFGHLPARKIEPPSSKRESLDR